MYCNGVANYLIVQRPSYGGEITGIPSRNRKHSTEKLRLNHIARKKLDLFYKDFQIVK